MTSRTQRLFCFLVVLGGLATANRTLAQGWAAQENGLSFGRPAENILLLNSSTPPLPLPPAPQRFSVQYPGSAPLPLLTPNGLILANYPPVLFRRPPVSGENAADPVTGFLESSNGNGLTPIRFIPSDNYYVQSGFFCKREWELERSTHIPFRFRLGSLAQCDALEGKP